MLYKINNKEDFSEFLGVARRGDVNLRISYEEEDTCMSYEEEDTCMSYEEDTCMSYAEEDTCLGVARRGDVDMGI